MSPRPLANAHIHVPPNFSAFRDAEDVIATAAREGVRVVGASNFHDQRVYRRFADAATGAGLVPLFGMELITVLEAERSAGTRINDPANPGRMYLCGKGIDPFRIPSPEASRIDAAARGANIARAARMTMLLRERFAAAGVPVRLDDAGIALAVATRAGVPVDWVVLQERHLAMAFQEALFEAVAPDDRVAALTAVYGTAPAAGPEDAVAIQGEIRSRLMKAGGPAFVDESPLTFEDGVRLVLEWNGIPAYPVLADGVAPVCEFEASPDGLADRLVALGIHAAELIPVRNDPDVLDTYVAALRGRAIVVTAGTEHNTLDRIPVAPTARKGAPISDATLDVFHEGACVVAAHQAERAAGRTGFVGPDGSTGEGAADPEAWIRRFAAIGEAVIDERSSSK